MTIIYEAEGATVHVGPARASPGVAILVEKASEPNLALRLFREAAYNTGKEMDHGRPICVDSGWVVFGRAW